VCRFVSFYDLTHDFVSFYDLRHDFVSFYDLRHDFVSFYDLRHDFGIVPTMWYFCFSLYSMHAPECLCKNSHPFSVYKFVWVRQLWREESWGVFDFFVCKEYYQKPVDIVWSLMRNSIKAMTFQKMAGHRVVIA
jgi:hypothetical protein